jgi:cytochrome c556
MALRAKLIMGAAAAIFAMGAAAPLFAQDMPPKIDDPAKAAAAAKERSAYMGMLSDNEKILVNVMKGQAPLDDKAIAAAEKIYASTDAKEILSHFNPGSGDDVVPTSRARALIWSEWDKVKEIAAGVRPAAAATLAAAKAGDQAAFAEKEQATVNACNTCHKTYRGPRKQQ